MILPSYRQELPGYLRECNLHLFQFQGSSSRKLAILRMITMATMLNEGMVCDPDAELQREIKGLLNTGEEVGRIPHGAVI